MLPPMSTSRKGSHPTWVRGLKFQKVNVAAAEIRSHPTWVRGLKSDAAPDVDEPEGVAPHVGAWIEIQFL